MLRFCRMLIYMAVLFLGLLVWVPVLFAVSQWDSSVIDQFWDPEYVLHQLRGFAPMALGFSAAYGIWGPKEEEEDV